MTTTRERAVAIARRAVGHPGMITAGEISALASAFLELTGGAEKHAVAEPVPPKAVKAKRGKGKGK
jgi:hypothetical protein